MKWTLVRDACVAILLFSMGVRYARGALKFVQSIQQNRINLPKWLQWLDVVFPHKMYEGKSAVWVYRIVGLTAIVISLLVFYSVLRQL